MRTSKIFRAMSACVGLLVASTRAASALCTGNVVPTPQFEKQNAFSATFATTADDVWTVGSLNSRPMVEHWNGEKWSRTAVPLRVSSLDDVAAVSPSDVWAVGQGGGDCTAGGKEEAIHWDGSQWTNMAINLFCDAEDVNLASVAVVKPNELWAVGIDIEPGPVGVTIYNNLALHWTGGKHWTKYDFRDDADTNGLTSVRAASPNDVWAVGGIVYRHSTSYDQIYHWDGSRWSLMEFRNPERVGGLIGLGVVSARDVWAVGAQKVSEKGPIEPLILHWDGTTWAKIPHAKSDEGAYLTSVVAVSANDVWAVGSGPPDGPHVEHWNGSEWSTIPTDFQATLTGVGVIPGNQSVWAVGSAPEQQFGVQSLAIDYRC